ncbi:MAG: bifunctional protein-disulfide isomerase/oxidoreductase DsbC [Pseudomonadales bacterium]|jgi:thiol:disulfide interchange protein DsbC|uniref:bifunctional protein-disulfide isomerase/oxidoreductase DsbC n=1 Tax=Halopseudomonas TaxID=2901189 RepID=UPI000C617B85|nr:bifunctional protein-disulfide isomerase/oxidoreductase DsbC [Halopseudomonas aestusnigri]MAH00286.1 bifunctional protein-disulfide isomerase/oxidoreductase DsbC [Pseudomonadales bacterium]MEE2799982.1 bifunctional protein-disulfide isomerase/oxidoreductase DsbC [Pseudomonadota bacterium]HBT56872.1 bifunctional protein-disulfide isomerase/oxidoreductase DsbC [Pseudomonas sp.]MAK75292.1 bifunctional protein-disulfide isomerase/oxidoreductase DsbC [Pseudomonadales bacterium]MAP76639.1 bifunct|tara:strand:+ start:6999 stop:7718 length:720 start_codon:yes stop_codon:yes gene_type:complete
MRLKIGLAAILALAATQVMANPDQAIRDALKTMNFNVPVKAVSESPVAGLYSVELESGRVLYASADGKYFVQGSLIEVNDGKPRNLTSIAEARNIGAVINGLPQQELIVFAPEQPKTHITVFTDVDCGYCRKLHNEVQQLNDLGIEVRYAAFPRGGMQSRAASVMQSVWCADDRKAALTAAKQGDEVAPASCENPVERQFELGQQVGVQGTPAIFMANGVLIPGYQPAAQLAAIALENQ